MPTPPRLLLVGLGDLGARVLGQVLQRGFPVHVGVAGRNAEQLQRVARLHQLNALHRDMWTPVDVVPLNLQDTAAAAETLAAWRPDVVFNAMSLQSWRMITALPRTEFDRLDAAQLGPWLPMHAVLLHRLMRALKVSGLTDVFSVNAAFPDATNPLMATAGLAPTTGVGNVANIVPALRCSAAHVLGASDPRATQVYFWAQHFLSHGIPRSGNSGGAPFCLRVIHRGEDVTARLDPQEVFGHVGTTFRRQGGIHGQELTAGSSLTVLEGLLAKGGQMVHAPGPLGLPGGWPVCVGTFGVEPLVPPGHSQQDMVKVNQGGQARDGIERIDPDGTVWFTPENMEVMKQIVDWNVRRLALGDMEDAAVELGAKYRAHAAKHGVAR